MKNTLEIKWPWTLMYLEYADEFIAEIKDALPPDHPLRQHEIFPGIKMEGRSIFIIDDDTTGERILVNFEKMKRWKKTKFRAPTMKVFKDDTEIAQMIERDHLAECAKYNEDGTLK